MSGAEARMLRRPPRMQHMPTMSAGQVRQFQDSRQRDWRVFERRKNELDREVTILIFESESSFRVVRDFPANWYELEPEALEYLSWRA